MKTQFKGLVLVSCFLMIFSAFSFYSHAVGFDTVADVPIIVSLQNTSQHHVSVRVLSMATIVESHSLDAGNVLELQVPAGYSILIEYPTSPYKTELSPMGSLNELSRTVLLRDDGDHLFIQEKFSGQLEKQKGQLRSKQDVISQPGKITTDMSNPNTRNDRGVSEGGSKAASGSVVLKKEPTPPKKPAVIKKKEDTK